MVSFLVFFFLFVKSSFRKVFWKHIICATFLIALLVYSEYFFRKAVVGTKSKSKRKQTLGVNYSAPNPP